MYCVHCPWAVETACAPARLATKQRGGEFSVVNMRVCGAVSVCVCVLTQRGYLLHHITSPFSWPRTVRVIRQVVGNHVLLSWSMPHLEFVGLEA